LDTAEVALKHFFVFKAETVIIGLSELLVALATQFDVVHISLENYLMRLQDI